MGEAYGARDTRLGRTVAIKVLPIEAVATLNDPRICTLHDIGVAKDGQRFLIPVVVPSR
jgi:hypothetical protein